MLTIEQCRAARGLLGWTQQNLADASGLSKTAINNFEKGRSDIKSESLRALRQAFEMADVEFVGEFGVTKRSDSVQVLKGANALDLLFSDIRTSDFKNTNDVLVGFITPSFAGKISPKALLHYNQFLSEKGYRQRVLCSHGSFDVFGPHDDYRWVDVQSVQDNMTSIVYGSKVAFKLWNKPIILILHNQDAAEAERARFENFWNQAETPIKEKTAVK